jgi:uncharacterized LabA/DUF88 family protein
MMFVDGENLAKRYASMLGSNEPQSHVHFLKDVFVWSRFANRESYPRVIRRHYYTSAPGDLDSRKIIEDTLRGLGVEAPSVFHRDRSGRSKRVDITLATDMLSHAHRKNFDVAVLIAGDADYVPLVEAVKREGQQVALWFLPDGLSPALRASADHYWDLGELLFSSRDKEPAFLALFG